MPSISFNITQSDALLGTNVNAGVPLVMNITNPLQGASYFGLETVPNSNGFYDSTITKNLSGSFVINSGISNVVYDDYKMVAVVNSGTAQLTYTPSVNMVGDNVRVRGAVGNLSGSLSNYFTQYEVRVLASGGYVDPSTENCVNNASDILKQASFLMIPSGYGTGSIFAQNPDNGNGDLTFTRASSATRVASGSILSSVGNSIARLDYSYGDCPALLLEPQRTNIFRWSERFDEAVWSKGSTSITPNSTTAPDGSGNGMLLTCNGTAGIKNITQNLTVISGSVYTVSIYAKKGTGDYVQITSTATLFGANVFANYDLNNGVLGSVGTSNISASIEDVRDGWYRCILTATALTSTTSTIGLYPIPSATSGRAPSNTLDTTYYIWGAQFEHGSTLASSAQYVTTYIKNENLVLGTTRTADTFTRNNIYTNGLISASGGTWYVEFKNNISYAARDAAGFFGIGDTSALTTNSLVFLASTNGRQVLRKYVAGASSILFPTTTDNVKLVVKWNGTTADIFVNGGKVVSATPFTATIMEFFNGNSADFPKFIQAMALFNEPLDDIDCEVITGTGYVSYSAMATALGYTVI